MALMIPYTPFDTRSEGEIAVFKSLQNGLDENYIVFHSVRWVRSTRKSQGEADFLILHRSLGILIIEVKAGFIRCEGRRWFQQNRNTKKEEEIQDPMNQADSSKFKFLELLQDEQVPIKDCLVCHAVWYPSFTWNYPMPPHYAPEILFDAATLDNPQESIEASFALQNTIIPQYCRHAHTGQKIKQW